jgi:DNA (cytosine-5)-methyltransferase 1
MDAVDLFAGLGGSTCGAKAAGARVLWAANHWQVAVDTHRANHPEVQHACQDLHQVDWSIIPRHHLLLASPECNGHTNARGKEQPRHDKSRSTAWAVVGCAEYHRPELIVVENVPAFLKWCLYPAWELAMQRLGYHLTPHSIDAADCGLPQHRVRLFIVLSRRAPIRLHIAKRDHVPFRHIIDWSLDTWSPLRSMCARTRSRARNGRKQFGDTFLVPYYSSARTGRSIDRPLGTVTTRARFSLVHGDRQRMLSVGEYRAAMGFPASYKLPVKPIATAIHLLGNAVPPPMLEAIVEQLRKS